MDSTSGNNQVHVRMEFKSTTVGMEDGMGTCNPSEPAISASKGGHRLPGGFEQQVVHLALPTTDQPSQLSWNRESNEEILNQLKFCLLSLNPALAVVVLAAGETAMAARVGHLDAVLAIAALQHHQVAALATAAGHGLQGLAVTGQQLGAMDAFEFALVGVVAGLLLLCRAKPD